MLTKGDNNISRDESTTSELKSRLNLGCAGSSYKKQADGTWAPADTYGFGMFDDCSSEYATAVKRDIGRICDRM